MNRLDGVFEYRDSVPSSEEFPGAGLTPPVVVRLPRGLAHKQELLAEYVRQLALPAYFGWNWDALEECLTDLSWLAPGQGVTIVHAGLPLRGRSRATYLSLLSDVAQHWRGSQARAVRIVFPRALAMSIEAALESGEA